MTVLFFNDQLPYISELSPKEQLTAALKCLLSLLQSKAENTVPLEHGKHRDVDIKQAFESINEHPLRTQLRIPIASAEDAAKYWWRLERLCEDFEDMDPEEGVVEAFIIYQRLKDARVE